MYFVFVFGPRSKDDQSQSDKEDTPPAGTSRFWVNIFVLNRREVLENIVRNKISKSKPVRRALAKRLAVNLVSDEKLVGKIGEELSTSISVRLESIGVRSVACIAYQQSAFISVEVILLSIDVRRVLEVRAGELALKKYDNLMQRKIPFLGSIIDFLLTSFVFGKVRRQLSLMIKEKLNDKLTAEVEIFTCTEEEQGPFIMSTLSNLNEKDKNEESNLSTN